MNVVKVISTSFLALSIFSQILIADEVTLLSGDHLIGTVQEINKQHIVIDTAFANGLKIKHSMIVDLSTDKPITIVFDDGQSEQGKLSKTEDSVLMLTSQDDEIPLDINQLAEVPSESLAKLQKKEQKIVYSGGLDLGLSRDRGNDDEDDYAGKLEFEARTLNYRYTLEAIKVYEKDNGEKTQEETYGSFQVDRFFNEKVYGYGSVSFEENFEEFLNLKSTYSLGVGRQLYDRDDLKMKSEFGLAYVDEDLKDDADKHYPGARWAFNYQQDIFEWLGVFHKQEGFISLQDKNEINISSSSGFKFPLSHHINVKLTANLDWDKSPAEEAVSTDKEYLFTLGYEF
jgi:putative salt-induced outer membrane protein